VAAQCEPLCKPEDRASHSGRDEGKDQPIGWIGDQSTEGTRNRIGEENSEPFRVVAH